MDFNKYGIKRMGRFNPYSKDVPVRKGVKARFREAACDYCIEPSQRDSPDIGQSFDVVAINPEGTGSGSKRDHFLIMAIPGNDIGGWPSDMIGEHVSKEFGYRSSHFLYICEKCFDIYNDRGCPIPAD